MLLEDTHGLERFRVRMAVVDLTGAVARWAGNVHDGLLKVGRATAAAVFATAPPFAPADLTAADCDVLSDYVEARIDLLRELLAQDSG